MKKALCTALAAALALTMSVPAYAAASGTVTEPVFHAEAVTEAEVHEDWTPIARNSKGETYGTIIQAQTQGVRLDLTAIRTEDLDGYFRESDTVWGKWRDKIKTPADALAYMAEVHSRPQKELLPLYDSEGNVIGEYLHTNWSDK